jgi:thiol-disulfide isomerase/thioredoxin
VIDSLSLNLADVSIKVVLGTWCSDSRREFPRFMKVLSALNFPMERLMIIGVNRSKTCIEAGVGKGFVDFVPTFIVYKNEVEVGRIVETPIKSLELDFYSIVSEN